MTSLFTYLAPCSLSCVCSDYMFFLNTTIAGVYNSSYPGTAQAFKVRLICTSSNPLPWRHQLLLLVWLQFRGVD